MNDKRVIDLLDTWFDMVVDEMMFLRQEMVGEQLTFHECELNKRELNSLEKSLTTMSSACRAHQIKWGLK